MNYKQEVINDYSEQRDQSSAFMELMKTSQQQ